MENQNKRRPSGGTELLLNNLCRYVPAFVRDKAYISVQIPQSGARHLKRFILWEHQSYDQPSVLALKDERILSVIDSIVFVSEWQKEQYIKHFPIPAEKAVVIKNAIEPIPEHKKPRSPLRLIYTSTPFRGLDVLLDAFELLDRQNIELHIYSGMSLYGSERAAEDVRFLPLYQKAQNMLGVFYHGVVSNEEVRKALQEAHIFAYPNTWEETSCLSLIEAMSAGTLAVIPEHGALSETASGYAQLYPFIADKKKHAERFASLLTNAIDHFWGIENQQRLREQKAFFDAYYSWNTRKEEWVKLINEVTQTHGQAI